MLARLYIRVHFKYVFKKASQTNLNDRISTETRQLKS